MLNINSFYCKIEFIDIKIEKLSRSNFEINR